LFSNPIRTKPTIQSFLKPVKFKFEKPHKSCWRFFLLTIV
jgi:hypothetical protein